MSIQAIEIPSHCPLCHKAMGDAVHHVVLRNATVLCVQCWHLAQEMTIKGFNELPEWLVHGLNVWRSVRLRLRLHYWFIERPHIQRVTECHTGETPVVEAEVPVGVA